MSPFIRIIFLTVFLICAGSLVYAVYLQLVKNLLPCPLCVAQRLSYWVIGLAAIVAVAHNPRSLGRRLYSGVMMIAALLGEWSRHDTHGWSGIQIHSSAGSVLRKSS